MESIEIVKQRLEQQPEKIIPVISNNFQLINPQTSKFFDYAVLTKDCQHTNKPLELAEILQTHKCSICQIQINNSNDLIKSPTEWALTYFSENSTDIQKRKQCKTQKCCILAGYYFHYYYRDLKFYSILTTNDDLIKQLMNNRNDQNNFIQLCLQDPKIRSLPQGHQYQYQPVCLLDKCKINIPVRHKNCKHPECYELSSLLQYAAELVQAGLGQSTTTKQLMKCCQEDCKVEFQMDFSSLKSDLVLDYELLTALRQSPAYCLNFTISTQTFKIENDFSGNNGIDRYIQKYHETKQITKNLEDFQNDVLRNMANYLQSNSKTQEILIKNKFKIIKKIDLNDPFTQYIVEYPVRCVKCPQNICGDLRTYLCEVIATSNEGSKFQCPQCKNQFNFKITQINQLTQNIYVDFNLQQQLIEYEYHGTQKTFDYHGDQYLLQEFIKRAQSQDVLRKIHLDKGLKTIEFTTLNCVKTKKRLNHPLKLPNCAQSNYISFQTLYDELVAVDFNYDIGLNFCNCGYCMQNPISMKKTSKDILIYEPLLQDALNRLNQYEKRSNKIQDQIVYDVERGTIIIIDYSDQTQINKQQGVYEHIEQKKVGNSELNQLQTQLNLPSVGAGGGDNMSENQMTLILSEINKVRQQFKDYATYADLANESQKTTLKFKQCYDHADDEIDKVRRDLENKIEQKAEQTDVQKLMSDLSSLREQFGKQRTQSQITHEESQYKGLQLDSDFLQQFKDLQKQVIQVESEVINWKSQFSQYQQIIGAKLQDIEKKLQELQTEKILSELMNLRELRDKLLSESEQNQHKIKIFQDRIDQFMTKDELIYDHIIQLAQKLENQRQVNYRDQHVSQNQEILPQLEDYRSKGYQNSNVSQNQFKISTTVSPPLKSQQNGRQYNQKIDRNKIPLNKDSNILQTNQLTFPQVYK